MPMFAAHKLRQAREDAGLSREQLAIDIERSYPLVSAYEGGFRTPSLRTLTLIANVLGRDMGFFFEDDSDAA